MAYYYNTFAALGKTFKYCYYLVPGLPVEISRRLVSQDYLRVVRKCPCYRGPLLLTARELQDSSFRLRVASNTTIIAELEPIRSNQNKRLKLLPVCGGFGSSGDTGSSSTLNCQLR